MERKNLLDRQININFLTLKMVTGVFLPWLLATAGFAQYMHASDRVNFAPFSKDFFKWYFQMFKKTR